MYLERFQSMDKNPRRTKLPSSRHPAKEAKPNPERQNDNPIKNKIILQSYKKIRKRCSLILQLKTVVGKFHAKIT